MRHLPHLPLAAAMLAVAAVAAGSAHAQSDAEQADAMAFLDSLALPLRAQVCAEHLPGYADRFQPVFARWRAARQPRIAAGEATMRAAAAKAGVPMEPDVRTVTQRAADLLRASPPEMLKQDCDEMLAQVSAGAEGR